MKRGTRVVITRWKLPVCCCPSKVWICFHWVWFIMKLTGLLIRKEVRTPQETVLVTTHQILILHRSSISSMNFLQTYEVNNKWISQWDIDEKFIRKYNTILLVVVTRNRKIRLHFNFHICWMLTNHIKATIRWTCLFSSTSAAVNVTNSSTSEMQ